MIAMPIDNLFWVRVLLSHTVTQGSVSLMLVIFSSEFIIYDVAPEFVINVSLSFYGFYILAINT